MTELDKDGENVRESAVPGGLVPAGSSVSVENSRCVSCEIGAAMEAWLSGEMGEVGEFWIAGISLAREDWRQLMSRETF